MIKIFMSVRNRLAITQHAISALQKHTKGEYQLYVYNNSTNYLIDEHWEYLRDLYKSGQVAQVSFTTDVSTFRAFQKAATCNFFGLQHHQDPKKEKYEFLVMMDNDMIVRPDWDVRARAVLAEIDKRKWRNILVVSQIAGGIMQRKKVANIPGFEMTHSGKLGGSGFWIVRNNFFKQVGVLDLKQLVGDVKKHDQFYWKKLNKVSGGKDYILGVLPKFCYHCGAVAGSVCNTLNRNKKSRPKEALNLIKFEESQKILSSMTFDEFYKWLHKDEKNQKIISGW